MLKTKTEKYAHPAADHYEVAHGSYFPDDVVDGFNIPHSKKSWEMTPIKPPTQPVDYIEPTITLDQSKDIIISALKEIDPALGQKADEILNDRNRMNVHEIEHGKSGMMACRLAETTLEDLAKRGMDMIPPQFAADFAELANPNSYSIIDFQHGGTVDSTVYLAHELGHAIADDYQREAGNNHADNPFHMQEIQAYLVQTVVRNKMMESPDGNVAHAAKKHFADEINDNITALKTSLDEKSLSVHGRPISLLVASGITEKLKELSSAKHAIETVLGRNGSKNINETLATIGIERESDFSSFITDTMSAVRTKTITQDLAPTAKISLPNAP